MKFSWEIFFVFIVLILLVIVVPWLMYISFQEAKRKDNKINQKGKKKS